VQSSSQIVTTNTPLFSERMPFLSPNQQRQESEGKNPLPHYLAKSNFSAMQLCS